MESTAVDCHSFYPFFEGISENAYKEATLDDYASTTVVYNDNEISFYDATQKQRYIERKIRQAKREAEALDEIGFDNYAEKMMVKKYQAMMRDFVKQTGLNRQGVRELI